MREEVFAAVIRRDETVALGVVEPLHRTCSHVLSFLPHMHAFAEVSPFCARTPPPTGIAAFFVRLSPEARNLFALSLSGRQIFRANTRQRQVFPPPARSGCCVRGSGESRRVAVRKTAGLPPNPGGEGGGSWLQPRLAAPPPSTVGQIGPAGDPARMVRMQRDGRFDRHRLARASEENSADTRTRANRFAHCELTYDWFVFSLPVDEAGVSRIGVWLSGPNRAQLSKKRRLAPSRRPCTR